MNRKGYFMIYGRARFRFQKLFPDAKFEGYELGIRYCYFTVKNKDISRVKRICDSEKIKWAL